MELHFKPISLYYPSYLCSYTFTEVDISIMNLLNTDQRHVLCRKSISALRFWLVDLKLQQ